MAEVEAPQNIPQEVAPVDIPSEVDTAGQTSGMETETDKEGSPKTTKKEGVPPKRAPIAAKRPGTVPASSTAKVASASVTRTTSGGLSKPPTRPAAGSAVRKAATTTAAPISSSTGHKSVPSTSSVDEKKPLPKRTSLAPSSSTQNSPGKTITPSGTAAAARKPATSATPSSPAKPPTKAATPSTGAKTSVTNGTTTTRSAPAAKPTTTGPVAEAKKRLSTLTSSLGTGSRTIPKATGATAPSPSSKEVDDLKAKLGESEARVEELKSEIATSQEKQLELSRQLQDEAQRLTEAEENIRAEHHRIVEKLHSTYKSNVDALQSQLLKDASDHTSALGVVTTELISTRQAHNSAIAAKQAEVDALKDQIETAQVEIKTLNDKISSLQAELDAKLQEYESKLGTQNAEHASALEEMKKSLSDDQETSIAALELSHRDQVRDLSAKHESATKDFRKLLEEATASQATLEAVSKQKFDSQSEVFNAKIADLEAQLKSLAATSQEEKKASEASKAELSALTPKLETTQKELTVMLRDYEELQVRYTKIEEDLSNSNQAVMSLQKMMDVVDEESKSQNEVQNKLKAELAALRKGLEDKNKEMSTLQEKHRKELEMVSDDYLKEIEALGSNSGFKEKYEELVAKYEELIKSQSEGSASHAEELEKAKKDHAAAVEALKAIEIAQLEALAALKAKAAAHQDTLEESKAKEASYQEALEALKTTHAEELDEAHDRAITAGDAQHAAELEQLQASHAEAIAALKMEHEAAQESLSSVAEKRKAAEGVLVEEITMKTADLSKAQAELDALRLELAKEKSAKAAAQADLDALKTKKPDTSEIDALRLELKALKDAKQASLLTAQQESARAAEELKSTKDAFANAQAEAAANEATAETKRQTYEADFKDMHDSLTQLVEEANKKAADNEALLKELEANLKVKDAEIAELKTKAASAGTPAKASGLRASRFAEKLGDEPAAAGGAEGEHDSSSAALASLAAAKVTVSQVNDMNEDLKAEHLRMLKSIMDIPEAYPASSGVGA